MKKIISIAARNLSFPDSGQFLRKTRVCAYCRVSTGSLKQSESLETQISYYERHIKNKSGWEYAGVFADEGISGTGMLKRTEFNRMIRACELGKVDLIMTKSISRFARNSADCIDVVRHLKNIGVGVYFERENINTLGADSELVLSILSSIAQDESRNISENVKWGIQKRFREGKFYITTKRFLGYDLNNEKQLTVNSEEGKIVKRIYREYLNGRSLKEIKSGLEKDNIKTVTGNRVWNESAIKYILQNEKYCGDAVLQKTITVDYLTGKRKKNKGEAPKYEVKEHHEAIISKEDFLKVQNIRKIKALKYGNLPENRDKYQNRYAFSGKIICGNCGAFFSRRTWNSKAKSKQIVWQCRTYINEGKSSCCMKAVDDITLKAVFVRVFNRIYEAKEDFFKRFADNIEKVLKRNEKCEDILRVDREIENISGKIKELVRKQIKGELEESTFDKRYRNLKDTLQEFKNRRNSLSYNDEKYKKLLERNKRIKKFIEDRDGIITEFDDDIFENLIEKIVAITPTHLEFHFKNGMVVEEEFIKKKGIKGLQ
ncbi:recombinase family protein [Clostridium ljungdahlii]|uniref:Transposon Tn3 resolvase n=1 Tax=Clostridium ljungdahlii (strain ATCC 55383 / DSM 13528 / PETC) TaxID=748727 RepID=A0ABX2TXY5_CLOLD|nr:recombinase family protein [Clostridium ljungdahlii]OAA89077.1 Transposon Tn3 resolvase [Clostridium ljungdahlii DSM 13528]